MPTAKKKTITRDVGTGEFTEASRAKSAPTKTVQEQVPVKAPAKSASSRSAARDAGSGEFITKAAAAKRPGSAVNNETVAAPRKAAPRKKG